MTLARKILLWSSGAFGLTEPGVVTEAQTGAGSAGLKEGDRTAGVRMGGGTSCGPRKTCKEKGTVSGQLEETPWA